MTTNCLLFAFDPLLTNDDVKVSLNKLVPCLTQPKMLIALTANVTLPLHATSVSR